MEDEAGTALEAFESGVRGGAIGIGVRPSFHTIVVTVGDKTCPECGNFVVVEANIAAGNGAAAESS